MNKSYVTVCALDAVGLRKMVRRGRELADQTGCALRILLFQHTFQSAALLEYTFQCAKSVDAEMNAFYTSDENLIRRRMSENSAMVVLRGDEPRLLRLSGGLSAARLEICV